MQYRNKGYQNRNRIKTIKGWQWLTMPIVHDWGQPINKVKILNKEQNGAFWYEQHLRTLEVNYGKAPFYDNYIRVFEKVYNDRHEMLVDFNLAMLRTLFEILGIHVKITRTSEMSLSQSKTNLIIEICKLMRSGSYLSGAKGAAYMDESLFPKNGIELLYNNYEHPVYNQQFMQLGFLPYMSIIDLIFNHGADSLQILKKGFKGFYDKPQIASKVQISGTTLEEDTPSD